MKDPDCIDPVILSGALRQFVAAGRAIRLFAGGSLIANMGLLPAALFRCFLALPVLVPEPGDDRPDLRVRQVSREA
jgi:hypothetical protein